MTFGGGSDPHGAGVFTNNPVTECRLAAFVAAHFDAPAGCASGATPGYIRVP